MADIKPGAELLVHSSKRLDSSVVWQLKSRLMVGESRARLLRANAGVKMNEGEPISYMALEPGARVLTRTGTDFGEVGHVLQIPELDLFDGITVRTNHGLKFVDRDQIDEITTTRVTCTIDDSEVPTLPKPHGTLVMHPDPGYDEGPSLKARYSRMFGHEHWKELE
jgi:hypothetical protein